MVENFKARSPTDPGTDAADELRATRHCYCRKRIGVFRLYLIENNVGTVDVLRFRITSTNSPYVGTDDAESTFLIQISLKLAVTAALKPKIHP